jgi:hypothetical protein
MPINAKVGISAFAGAVVSFILFMVKSRLGFDLSGQESNLIVIVMALVGWLVPDGKLLTQK